jgi:tellurite methyltransferase
MKRNEKTLWNRKYSERSHMSLEPDPLLVSAYSEFIAGTTVGTVLDVAGGVGRHALWLAERGWKVSLVDVSEVGIKQAIKNLGRLQHGTRRSPKVQVRVVDLKKVRDFGHQQYDLILVFYYLQRSLFPALVNALRPGGHLIYKTYTLDQQRFSDGPRHRLHLLKPNELLRAFASLRILHYHETIRERGMAELAARKPESVLR